MRQEYRAWTGLLLHDNGDPQHVLDHIIELEQGGGGGTAPVTVGADEEVTTRTVNGVTYIVYRRANGSYYTLNTNTGGTTEGASIPLPSAAAAPRPQGMSRADFEAQGGVIERGLGRTTNPDGSVNVFSINADGTLDYVRTDPRPRRTVPTGALAEALGAPRATGQFQRQGAAPTGEAGAAPGGLGAFQTGAGRVPFLSEEEILEAGATRGVQYGEPAGVLQREFTGLPANLPITLGGVYEGGGLTELPGYPQTSPTGAQFVGTFQEEGRPATNVGYGFQPGAILAGFGVRATGTGQDIETALGLQSLAARMSRDLGISASAAAVMIREDLKRRKQRELEALQEPPPFAVGYAEGGRMRVGYGPMERWDQPPVYQPIEEPLTEIGGVSGEGEVNYWYEYTDGSHGYVYRPGARLVPVRAEPGPRELSAMERLAQARAGAGFAGAHGEGVYNALTGQMEPVSSTRVEYRTPDWLVPPQPGAAVYNPATGQMEAQEQAGIPRPRPYREPQVNPEWLEWLTNPGQEVYNPATGQMERTGGSPYPPQGQGFQQGGVLRAPEPVRIEGMFSNIPYGVAGEAGPEDITMTPVMAGARERAGAIGASPQGQAARAGAQGGGGMNIDMMRAFVQRILSDAQGNRRPLIRPPKPGSERPRRPLRPLQAAGT